MTSGHLVCIMCVLVRRGQLGSGLVTVERNRMAIEFYNVKTRQKVGIEESQVRKVKYLPQGAQNPRFALKAEQDGTSLTKFISKATYETLNVPEG